MGITISSALKVAIFTSIALSFVYLIDKALFWKTERDELIEWTKNSNLPIQEQRVTTLFIGDSITKGFPLRTAFPQNFITVNKGVNGNTIGQIAERYNEEIKTTPHDLVVFEGGVNDILACVVHDTNEKATREAIIATYRKIIELAKSQGKYVIAIEILPVTYKFLLPHTKTILLPNFFNVPRMNQLIRQTNSDLRQLCAELGVQFVETQRVFLNSDGQMNRAFVYVDGYHVNVAGYKTLTSVIEPYLVEGMAQIKKTNKQAKLQIVS